MGPQDLTVDLNVHPVQLMASPEDEYQPIILNCIVSCIGELPLK
jgi:hypothetical protein